MEWDEWAYNNDVNTRLRQSGIKLAKVGSSLMLSPTFWLAALVIWRWTDISALGTTRASIVKTLAKFVYCNFCWCFHVVGLSIWFKKKLVGSYSKLVYRKPPTSVILEPDKSPSNNMSFKVLNYSNKWGPAFSSTPVVLVESAPAVLLASPWHRTAHTINTLTTLSAHNSPCHPLYWGDAVQDDLPVREEYCCEYLSLALPGRAVKQAEVQSSKTKSTSSVSRPLSLYLQVPQQKSWPPNAPLLHQLQPPTSEQVRTPLHWCWWAGGACSYQ